MADRKQAGKMNSVGERLRFARDKKGYTAYKLAKLSGVSTPQISQIEAGTRGSNLSFEVAYSLAEALHVRPEWLVRGEGDPDTEEKYEPVDEPRPLDETFERYPAMFHVKRLAIIDGCDPEWVANWDPQLHADEVSGKQLLEMLMSDWQRHKKRS